MPLLSQKRFPRLWSLFQFWVGGTADKRKLCRLHYKGEQRILEVGCASGNISRAFVKQPGIEFTGLDIDPVAVDLARKHFVSYPNFVFKCQDVTSLLTSKNNHFDYILFAGVCHHVNDTSLSQQLNAAAELLAPTGSLVIVEPLIPDLKDSWFIRLFIQLEQGCYLRTGKSLVNIIERTENLSICDNNEFLITASPFGFPVCARFGVYRVSKG